MVAAEHEGARRKERVIPAGLPGTGVMFRQVEMGGQEGQGPRGHQVAGIARSQIWKRESPQWGVGWWSQRQ